MDFRFITNKIIEAKKNMYAPKEQKNPNKLDVGEIDYTKRPKLTPEELEMQKNVKRRSGPWNGGKVKPEPRRNNNPKYQDD